MDAHLGGRLAFLPAVCRRLEALGGLTTEGLFRVPGAHDAVRELLERVGDVSAADGYDAVLQGCADVHDAASLLTKWLREQNQLIPEASFARCAELASPPPPRAAVCSGWLENKTGLVRRDAANVLHKERNFAAGGRRSWKRRRFVLHEDGGLAMYREGQAPPDAASDAEWTPLEEDLKARAGQG